MKKSYAWICRNRDGILLMYEYKPSRTEDDWFEPFGHYFVLTEEELPEGVNPRWEDKPVLVEIKLLAPQCRTKKELHTKVKKDKEQGYREAIAQAKEWLKSSFFQCLEKMIIYTGIAVMMILPRRLNLLKPI